MIRLLKNTKLINMSSPIAIKEKPEEDLPYVQLRYIETSGSQYIETGVGSNANKVRIKSKVLFTQKGSGQDGFVWSSRTWSYQYGNMYGYGDLYNDSGSSQLTLYYGRNQSTGINSFDKDTEYEIDCIADETSIDITINDNHQTISRTMDAPTANIVLFRQGDESAYYAKCKLYYLQIYLENKLVRNFIPVIMKETKQVGLYDLVTKAFYANQGGGNFVPSVMDVTQYTELDYIKSTGTQYINTGILAAGDTDIEVRFKCDATSPDYMRVYGIESAIEYEMCMGGSTNTQWYFNGSSSVRTINATTSFKTVKFTASDGKLYVDGEQLSTENIPGNIGKHIWLFRGSNRYSSIYLSYCKIWKSGVLVRDFIPIETKDGFIGLYDQVEQGLLINSGTGEFTPGSQLEPYTELKYIESTGTQYINTGYYPNGNSGYKLKISDGNSNGVVFGAYNSTWTNGNGFYTNIKNSSHRWEYYHYASNSQTSYKSTSTEVIEINKGVVVINNTQVLALSSKSFTVNRPLYVFAGNMNGSVTEAVKCRLYYFEIYDNDVKIMSLIPMRRNRDDVVGMYDQVSNVFYINSGTGKFIAGEFPLPHTEHEYIESTGTQFINTQYAPKTTTKLEIKFQNVPGNNNWATPLRSSSGTYLYLQWNDATGNDFAFYLNSNQHVFNLVLFDEHVAAADFSTGVVSVDGESYSLTPPSSNSGNSLYMFNSCKWKIGYLKIWEGSSLVHHFVPAKDSNNVGCLYDKVDNVLFYNEGTGDFVVGNEVEGE